MDEVARALLNVERRDEDTAIAIRYLENAVGHPDDPKYRRMKKANRKFLNEVWLQQGVREAFLAIGFREYEEVDSQKMVVLDPFSEEERQRARFALQGMQEIRRRKREGASAHDASVAAVAGVGAGAGAAGAGAAEAGSRSFETGRSSSDGSYGELTCQACGRTPLQEDTGSNRPDVLWRARRPKHAVTCTACGPEYFMVCGDCFNRQAYEHPPEHQLVLYAEAGRLESQSSWPTRNRGYAPPPPGPGSGGRPRRGPWG